jgi:hypothetical protein
MSGYGTGTDAGGRAWAPLAVNLGLGVPAAVPLYLAWWLLTEYAPMDCLSVRDLSRPGLVNCDYHTLDHAPIVMLLLAVTGLPALTAVIVVDVILPLRRGRRLSAWLGAAALVPVPFLALLALALA